MDPNANLAEQRRIAERLIMNQIGREQERLHDAARLAELVEALDEWITNGGFLPDAWRHR
jgi:hypothetical protein